MTYYKTYLFDPLGCDSIESIDGSAMTWANAHDLARVGRMLANRGAYGNLRFFNEDTFNPQFIKAVTDGVADE